MGFTCGVVGLPNVGKSTLFNALTNAGAQASNFPFCTIDPNKGIVPLLDARLDQIAAIIHPKQITPTTLEVLDIAGLVKGASQGEGLGNQFLGHIHSVEAILHVVRCFEDPNITHVYDKVDPVRDIEIIETELALHDLDIAQKRALKIRKQSTSEKSLKHEADWLEKAAAVLESGKLGRDILVENDEERGRLKAMGLLTAKPVLLVANTDDKGPEGNPYYAKAEEYARQRGYGVVPICAAVEAEIVQLAPEERKAFLEDLGETESGLDRLAHAGYRLLGLISFFTAGEKEVRAWTVEGGSKAPQAAGKIHSDFERGFIRAETVAFDDFIKFGGWTKAREAGAVRQEGKEYVVKDGDVMLFKFNV